MGQGSPCFPICPDCGNHMKGLYSQIKGMNQQKRIRGKYACFNTSHDIIATPSQPDAKQKILIHLQEEFRRFVETDGRSNPEYARKLKNSFFELFDKRYGEGSSEQLRRILDPNSLIDFMMNMHHDIGNHPYRIQMVFSNGRLGDYVLPNYLFEQSENIMKAINSSVYNWEMIEKALRMFGVKMNDTIREIFPTAYINTAVMLDVVKEIRDRLIYGEPFREIPLDRYMSGGWNSLNCHHLFSSPYVLNGFIVAWDEMNLLLEYSLTKEQRKTCLSGINELMKNGFDIRYVDPEMKGSDQYVLEKP